MQLTDEQGQSEARLARTVECDASSEEVQGSFPCREVTLDRRLCRTLQMDTVAKCPLERGELTQKRTLVPKKRLEPKRTRLSVLEIDIRQEVAN